MIKSFFSKILLPLILVTIFISPQKAFAQQPAVCNTGFCMVENQICPGGNITTDSTCSDSPYNGTACCIPDGTVTNPDSAFFNSLNPLLIGGSTVAEDLSTPGGIVSRILQFLFPLAGLVLFVMLIWGGFEILAKSAQGTKALDAGKNRITAALVGFFLLFATYWMAQIIETVFGIVIV